MSNQSIYKLFIFDFDGTLGDTSDCVVASFQGALEKSGLPKVSRAEIVQHMGISLPEVFKRVTHRQYDEGLYDTLVRDYRALYRNFLTQKTKIFPQVKETLSYLRDKGSKISIATSKKTKFAVESCQFLDIDQFIDFYIGDDMVDNKKPHPEMLEQTLRKLQVSAQDALMIGDASTDIEMGKALDMTTVAVTWGAHSREALKEAQPRYIIDSMAELRAFV